MRGTVQSADIQSETLEDKPSCMYSSWYDDEEIRSLDWECVYYNSNGDLLPDFILVYLRVEFDRIQYTCCVCGVIGAQDHDEVYI